MSMKFEDNKCVMSEGDLGLIHLLPMHKDSSSICWKTGGYFHNT